MRGSRSSIKVDRLAICVFGILGLQWGTLREEGEEERNPEKGCSDKNV